MPSALAASSGSGAASARPLSHGPEDLNEGPLESLQARAAASTMMRRRVEDIAPRYCVPLLLIRRGGQRVRTSTSRTDSPHHASIRRPSPPFAALSPPE